MSSRRNCWIQGLCVMLSLWFIIVFCVFLTKLEPQKEDSIIWESLLSGERVWWVSAVQLDLRVSSAHNTPHECSSIFPLKPMASSQPLPSQRTPRIWGFVFSGFEPCGLWGGQAAMQSHFVAGGCTDVFSMWTVVKHGAHPTGLRVTRALGPLLRITPGMPGHWNA